MADKQKIQNLLDKVEKVTKQKELDLSSGEDLSIGIMNLISIEEHLFYTSQKTKNKKYLDLLNEVRAMRTELLKEIIKDYEGEVWCLPANTVVFSNPEPRNIASLAEGDKVYTHRGKFSPVQKIYTRKYQGKMISIDPYYGDGLLLTPGHEILCATGVREKQKTLWRKEFKSPNVVWKKAEDITGLDFLLFPRYLETKNIDELELTYSWTNSGCFKPTTFKRFLKIKVDENLLALIGLYISEGSVSERKYPYKNSLKTQAALYLSFGKHETDLIRKTQRLFHRVFKMYPKVSETRTTIDLTCSYRVIVKFFKQFGKRSKEKELPFWVLKLPTEKLYPLIWGLVAGDGMIDKYQIAYFTSSEKLAYQLRMLLFKMGILHSLKRFETKGGYIEGRKIGPSHTYKIEFSGDSARILDKNAGLRYRVKKTSGNLGYVLNDYVMIPIRRVEKFDYNGLVYNLQTAAQTYTTHTGVVHNCISKHLLAASMRLMEVGTKELKKGNKDKAWGLFEKSYKLYSLFWGANLGVVDIPSLKREDSEVKMINEKGEEKASVSVFEKLGALVQKAINCCRE
jgi:intein/homing endonuclease